jgi:hypothetical protein
MTKASEELEAAAFICDGPSEIAVVSLDTAKRIVGELEGIIENDSNLFVDMAATCLTVLCDAAVIANKTYDGRLSAELVRRTVEKVGELERENESLRLRCNVEHVPLTTTDRIMSDLHESKQRIATLQSALKTAREALEQVVAWELPRVPDPMPDDPNHTAPYSWVYGSNGERDYMRNIAGQALAALDQPKAVSGEGTWPWALAQMKAGKRVRQSDHVDGGAIGISSSGLIEWIDSATGLPDRNDPFVFEAADFAASDWRIVDEPPPTTDPQPEGGARREMFLDDRDFESDGS